MGLYESRIVGVELTLVFVVTINERLTKSCKVALEVFMIVSKYARMKCV
jgi:hypothetical protein